MLVFSRAQVGTGIAVALICLVVVYAADYALTQSGGPPEPRVAYPQHEARLIELDREAIDAAYRQQVMNLYFSWMKDPTIQPARALAGVNRARAAYVLSMDAIERRARERENK
jgi:hypothetical protein